MALLSNANHNSEPKRERLVHGPKSSGDSSERRATFNQHTMKFIFREEKKAKTLTFADVAENQFFVSRAGYLWQKSSDTSCQCIAEDDGTPLAFNDTTFAASTPIQRMLPHVEKIEF